MTAKLFSLPLVALLLASVVNASPTSDMLAVRRSRDKSVKMGVWHADLDKARAYAEENGMPLIAVWSNGEDCSHCLVFEQMAMAPVFQDWMETSGYVFYFGVRDDGLYGPTADGKEGYHGTSFYWCRQAEWNRNNNAEKNWPYVRIYWRKTNGKVITDEFRTGAAIDGEYDAIPMPASKNCSDNPKKFVKAGDDKTYNPSARYFIHKMTNSVDGLLRQYKYNPVPPYRGGEFGVPDAKTAPLAGLQLEEGTAFQSITIPLTRTNATAQAYAATNTLVATYPSGTNETHKIVWEKNAKTYDNLAITLQTNFWEGGSKRISLMLYDGTNTVGAAVATNSIAIVSPVANSPKNPLWIGEKTPEALGWGEWTMDIDAATNKVAAFAEGGASAYTLMLVGGPLWCPDCVRLDKALFEKPAFKTWAQENRIACVAVDVPKFTEGTSPTLLNREVKNITNQFMKDNNLGGLVSGAGYLSRKNIALTNAAVVQARNDALISNDTEHGGLRLPEPEASTVGKTGKWKTGVPCIVMLRPDGTVCGRIYEYSNSTEDLESVGVQRILARLGELCAQASEKVGGAWAEESNDSILTTKNSVRERNLSGVEATLSSVDKADYYRINAAQGSEMQFTLAAAEDASTNAVLCLSVVNGDLKDPDGSLLTDAVGVTTYKSRLGDGIKSSFYRLPSSNCFVKVYVELNDKKYPVDPFFSQANEKTVCKYRLSNDSIVNPAETPSAWVSPDGNNKALLRLEGGQKYVFTGILPEENEACLERIGETDFYVAKEPDPASGGVVEIIANGKTEDDEWTFSCQKWNPGVIGFERASASVNEPQGETGTNECRIVIRRTGGVSGVAKFRLEIVPEETTSITNGLYVWNDAETVFEAENEAFVTNTVVGVLANPFANNNELVTLRIVALDGSDAAVAAGADRFTVRIKDDDVANPGKLRIGMVGGATVPESGLIVAKAGSTLKVRVDRVGGVDGVLNGLVTATGVAVNETSDRLVWSVLESASKTAEIVLPALGEVPGDRVQVTLNGLSESKVDPSAKYVTVQLTDDASVAFKYSSADWMPYRHVSFDATVDVDMNSVQNPGSTLSIEKMAGSVPPGLTWKLDVSSGGIVRLRVTGRATKTGSYRATFRVSEDGRPGQTVQTGFSVVDCAALPETSGQYNPSVGVTRTFDDVLVLDDTGTKLVGLMTLTIPPTGRMSAKVRHLDGTSRALLAEGWDDCVSGVYSASLKEAPAREDGYSVRVRVQKDGRVELSAFYESARELCGVVCEPVADASTWKGCYTVSLPCLPTEPAQPFATGAGYLTLKMNTDSAVATGSMLYVGMLPNGRTVSGSGRLVTAESFGAKDALLTIVTGSSEDSFSAALILNPTDVCQKVMPYAGVNPRWTHSGPGGSDFAVDMDAFGCLYVATNDFASCCYSQLGDTNLTFFAETDQLRSSEFFDLGAAACAWSTNSTGIKILRKSNLTNKIKLVNETAAAKNNGLTFVNDAETGIVSGTLRIEFEDGTSRDARFRGVVMPGWGTRDCSSCGDSPCLGRPFVSGSCFFDDVWNYVDEHGRNRATRVMRSCPFSVGIAPGL